MRIILTTVALVLVPGVVNTVFGQTQQTNAITTVAGNGSWGFSGDNGPATSAVMWGPRGIAVDSAGNLYIADTNNYRIRKVSNGVITTVAGNGSSGWSGDNGPATNANIGRIVGLTVDSAGNLYLADTSYDVVRKVSNGVITTVAGNRQSGFNGDNGPAANALLFTPSGVAVDSFGNLYIADCDNQRIRKVSNGVITTVAGKGPGDYGDGGPAVDATFGCPVDVAVDSAGNLYIVDSEEHRVRKVSNGVITAFAGGGGAGAFGDDGPATRASFYSPNGIAVDSAGNVYIADTENHRIRKISNGVITTVAGRQYRSYGFSGDDGPATNAQLYGPERVAVDSAGNVYIADTQNHRIRKVSSSGGGNSPTLSVGGVVNAASYASGPVAPGELVTLFGTNLGPAVGVATQLDISGYVSSSLSGTRVLFDETPAPVVYASSSQVTVAVPYAVAGKSSTVMQVESMGSRTSPVTLPVALSAPGLFTSNSSGKGQGAILNEDGTLNSPSNPAVSGSIVVLYGTGEGQTEPPGVDGKLAVVSWPKPRLPVSVTIGGVEAQLRYAGAAPLFVAGLLQVNAVVPERLTSANHEVRLTVGTATSPSGVTVAGRRAATVFLVHGIAQGAIDMAGLAETLSDPVYGIDMKRFSIDRGFDWSNCANNNACSADCTIQKGGLALGDYIRQKAPQNDIILIGYSMGGLIARDLMLNHNGSLFSNRRVLALITLGTPHLGYPNTEADDRATCGKLAAQMAGDFRGALGSEGLVELTDKDGQAVVRVSRYLADLNTMWTSATSFPGKPGAWLAIAGSYCRDPVRLNPVSLPSNMGCSDSKPLSDGVVCEQSALFDIATVNGPTLTLTSADYSHSPDWRQWVVFCGPRGKYPLSDPPKDGVVVGAIKNLINGLQ